MVHCLSLNLVSVKVAEDPHVALGMLFFTFSMDRRNSNKLSLPSSLGLQHAQIYNGCTPASSSLTLTISQLVWNCVCSVHTILCSSRKCIRQGVFKNIMLSYLNIMITSPCNEYPITPHFYIVKLGFTGVYISFLFLL